jgi:hypothetical protein
MAGLADQLVTEPALADPRLAAHHERGLLAGQHPAQGE